MLQLEKVTPTQFRIQEKIEYGIISWFLHVVIVRTLFLFDTLLIFVLINTDSQKCELKLMKVRRIRDKKFKKLFIFHCLRFMWFTALVTFKNFWIHSMNVQKQSGVFCKESSLRIFKKFQGKHLQPRVCNFIKKGFRAGIFLRLLRIFERH